jgi:hypothetical protein
MENQEKFYQWLLSLGNIHTADSERMSRAYVAIAENDEKIVVKEVVLSN